MNHANGAIIWVEVSFSRLPDIDGEPTFFVLYRNPEDVRDQYRKLIEGAVQPIMIYDAATYEVLFANDAALALFGKTGTPYAGKQCYRLFLGQQMPCAGCNRSKVLATGQDHDRFRFGDLAFNRDASRIRWNGRDAVAEYMSDIAAFEDGANALDEDFEAILKAFQNISGLIMAVNLTRNTYRMIQYGSFKTRKVATSGDFDESIKVAATTIHEDERERFVELFSREGLLRAHAEGAKQVVLRHKQFADEGFWHRVITIVLFLPEGEDGELREIALSVPYEGQEI